MDVDYGKNLNESGAFFHDFKHSLQVLSTVQSVSVSQWIFSHIVVSPSFKRGTTYLLTMESVLLVRFSACLWIATKILKISKFHWISKIPKPKCVSGCS